MNQINPNNNLTSSEMSNASEKCLKDESNVENEPLVLNNNKGQNIEKKINESKKIDENVSNLGDNLNNVPSNKSRVKNSNIDSENNGSESESESDENDDENSDEEIEFDDKEIEFDEKENKFKFLLVECNPNKLDSYKTSIHHFKLEDIEENAINNDTGVLDAVKKILTLKKNKINKKTEKERIDKLVLYYLYYIPKFDCDKYKEIDWLSIKGSNGNILKLKDVKELYINMRKNSKNEKYTFRKYLNEKYKLKSKQNDKSENSEDKNIDDLNDNETALEYDKLNINGTGAWIIYLIHETYFKKYMEKWKSDEERLEEERLNKLNMEKKKKLLLEKEKNARKNKIKLLDKIKKKRKRVDIKNVPSKKSKVYKKIEE